MLLFVPLSVVFTILWWWFFDIRRRALEKNRTIEARAPTQAGSNLGQTSSFAMTGLKGHFSSKPFHHARNNVRGTHPTSTPSRGGPVSRVPNGDAVERCKFG